jgi:hypothetical protein
LAIIKNHRRVFLEFILNFSHTGHLGNHGNVGNIAAQKTAGWPGIQNQATARTASDKPIHIVCGKRGE